MESGNYITENLLTQEQLQESNSRLQNILNSMFIFVGILDQQGVLLYANQVALERASLTETEVIGKSFADTYWWSYSPEVQERLRLALRRAASGEIVRYDEQVRLAQGRFIMIDVTFAPLCDSSGEITQLIGSAVDITQRHKAENALQVRSMQQSVIAQVGHFALQSRDINSLMELIINKLAVTLSVEYTKILEYFPDTDDLLLRAGVGWKEGLVGRDRVSAERNSQAGYTLLVDQPVIVEDLGSETRFSGPSLLFEHNVTSGMSVVIAGPERPWGVIGVHTRQHRLFTREDTDFLRSMANILADAIERYHADAELRRYKDIADTSDDVITFIDRNYRYLAVNQELLRLLNKDRSEIIGHTVGEVLGQDYFNTEVKEQIDRCLEGETLHLQHEYVDRRQGTIFLDIHYNPYRDRTGWITGVAFISRDVTRQKLMEKETQRYQHIADTTEDIMTIVDRNYVYQAVNRKFTEVFRIKKEGVIGHSIAEVFGEQLFQNIKEDFDRCLKGETFEVQKWSQLPGITGRCMHRIYSPFREADGAVTGVLVSSRDITDSRRAEEKLREYQRMIQTLMDNLPGVIYRRRNDANWTMELASKGIHELTGVPASEFLSGRAHWGDIEHPDDRKYVWDTVQSAMEGRRSYELEYRIINADGSVRWVWEQGSGVFDADGQVTALEGYVADITGYKNAQEEIRRYKDIVDTSEDMIAYVDNNHVYRAVNQPYLDFTGKSRDQVIGHSVEEILGGDYYYNLAKPNVERCMQGESMRLQRWFDMSDGRRLYEDVTLNPYRDETGDIKGLVFSGRDITNLKIMEEELQKTARKLLEAQHIAQMGFWEYDLVKDQHVWSDEVYTIFGVNRRDYIPNLENVSKIIHPDDREWVERERDRTIRENDRFEHTYRIIKPDSGEMCFVHNIGEISKDEMGKPIRMFGTVLDVTERSLAEEKLTKSRERLHNLVVRLQAVREEERTLIAREIHDELGQGLTALKIDLSLLKSRLPASWKKIPAHLQKMIADIDSTIDYVRKLSSSLRPPILDDLGLDAAIEWQIQGFAARTKCEYSLDIQEHPYAYDYDRETAVFRIFQESLNNVARHANARHVGVSLHYHDRVMVMNLVDDGVGISPEKIFDPHSIGLIGMHERAAMFGGEVEIKPHVSGGTSVTVTLPFAEPTA